eukprot:scaffold6322_cov59-Cylindrotheca_fusiformis.AAC.11
MPTVDPRSQLPHYTNSSTIYEHQIAEYIVNPQCISGMLVFDSGHFVFQNTKTIIEDATLFVSYSQHQYTTRLNVRAH